MAKPNIIQVVRVPPAKTFFPHFLGLTLGFVSVLVAIVALNYPLIQSVLWLGVFGAGTWLGALFVVLILPTLAFVYPVSRSLVGLYLVAYVAAWIFAVVYNWLFFVLLVKLGKRRLRISFAYDKNNKFNIIKSPIQGEEPTLDPESQSRKLYQFKLKVATPDAPYTIAFVANPTIPEIPDEKGLWRKM